MFENVLNKGKIGNVELKNRFVMPAIGAGHTEPDGSIGDETIGYYVARARGGFGLIIQEFAGVDLSGVGQPWQLRIYSDDFIPDFKKLVDAVHAEGAKIFMQIHHSGSASDPQLTGQPVISSSAIEHPLRNEPVVEMTTRQVYDMIEKFGDAAVRAKKAGYEIGRAHV
jgi:2,4-dienoyl-CoA reductase-like NADH-dependent reductase (Old Yellow Enzyme family)